MTRLANSIRHTFRHACALASALLLTILTISVSQADTSSELPTLQEARGVNENSVEIVFHFEDYYRRLIADMDREVSKNNGVRVIPVIGVNHLQSLYDQLYLRGIDLSIVHSDVFEYLARSQNYDRVFDRIHGLSTLYREKIAIIAGDQYSTLSDLDGQAVNFGFLGKGSDIAGTIVFDTLDIDVEPKRLEKFDAIEKVKSGEIAATVFLMEDSPDQLRELRREDKVTVLEIPLDQELLGVYTADELGPTEFPNLMDEDNSISTLSASVIIAAYNFQPSDGWRYTRLKKFVEGYVAGFENLQTQPGYEKAWAQASLTEEIPGVPRLSLVDEILKEREATRLKTAEAREASEKADLMKAQSELTTRLEERMADVDDPVELERILGELQSILDNAAE